MTIRPAYNSPYYPANARISTAYTAYNDGGGMPYRTGGSADWR
jgi:hypothetical protein